MEHQNTNRLGEILLEKGMINQEQLDIAIDEQTKRRQYQHFTDPLDTQPTALGEILIELGFITRLQLKRGLTWQMLLRKMTIAMSLCAPLMTLGAHASTTTPVRTGTTYAVPVTTTSSSVSSSSPARPVTTASSTAANQSNASSVASSASSAAASSPASVAGPVYLHWNIPNQRENGDYLDITELGGYELRYRRINDPSFTYVTINNAWASRYYFRWLEGAYEFQVAVFDKNGLYSQFVNLAPH